MGLKKGCRVLYVFETPAIMKAVVNRIQQDNDFVAFHRYFLFKHNGQLEGDFFGDWWTVQGQKVRAF